MWCHPFEEKVINQFYGFRLLRVYHNFPRFFILVQTKKSDVSKADLSIGKTLSLPPSDILRKAPAFLLSKARHNTYEEFPFTNQNDTK